MPRIGIWHLGIILRNYPVIIRIVSWIWQFWKSLRVDSLKALAATLALLCKGHRGALLVTGRASLFGIVNPRSAVEAPFNAVDSLDHRAIDRDLAFWRQHFAAPLPVLDLPSDRPRPAVPTRCGRTVSFLLPSHFIPDLRSIADHEDATLFMALFAAFNVLLHRYSSQDDIIVGSPIAGRNRLETENLISFYVNTLAIRTNLSGNPPFRQLLARVRNVCLEIYAHQDLPFDKVVEALNPDRDRSHSPFFRVIFALQADPNENMRLPGLETSVAETDTGTAKCDLSLFVSEKPDGLCATFEYGTDLFDPASIERIAGHFQMLLEGIVQDPDKEIGLFPLLTPAEREQLLVTWNQTAVEYPRNACIHQLFENQVVRTPNALALLFEDQSLTYEKLNERANRLAHFLRKRGVGPDALVGICMERSLDMIVALLAILKAGGAYVPLNPAFPEKRLRIMLEGTTISVVLTHGSFADRLPQSTVEVISLDRQHEMLERESLANPNISVGAENLAYINYTSGSTGMPKGVQIPHRGVVRLLMGSNYAQLDASRTFLQLSTISFDLATFEIWAPLLHGGRCVLFPGSVPTAEALGEIIQKHNVDTLWLTASLFNSVIDEKPEVLTRIRQLLIGGEALSAKHVRQALHSLPHTQIINGYGPTESTTFTCCYPVPPILDESTLSIPIGRP
ncbi:MAG: AMP-binding protein, partial [Acidobacteriota bacterium]